MKTFNDLVFKKHENGHMIARMHFENREGLSVIYDGPFMCDKDGSTYEVCYSCYSWPEGWQTPEEITKMMLYLQTSYKNAKHEILELAKEKTIKCIDIYMMDIDKEFTLPEYEDNITGELGYKSDNTILLLFLEDLDYCYEDDKCEGIIWFTDGTWAERIDKHKFDTCKEREGWMIFGCPEIPEELRIKSN